MFSEFLTVVVCSEMLLGKDQRSEQPQCLLGAGQVAAQTAAKASMRNHPHGPPKEDVPVCLVLLSLGLNPSRFPIGLEPWFSVT